jgi:hypothetical protein
MYGKCPLCERQMTLLAAYVNEHTTINVGGILGETSTSQSGIAAAVAMPPKPKVPGMFEGGISLTAGCFIYLIAPYLAWLLWMIQSLLQLVIYPIRLIWFGIQAWRWNVAWKKYIPLMFCLPCKIVVDSATGKGVSSIRRHIGY